jgi:signal transduction histidine kinase
LVEGDELELFRVFYNLLRNALSYSDRKEEKKYVRISAKQDRDHIVIFFKDNGIGVIKGEEEIIFQKFSRGTNASRVFPEGSGLGLSYSREIVRKHGGSIEIDREHTSKPTVIVVRLPQAAL